MIRYKCPKCFHEALLPNEMSYKFYICPACRWHSQVFGPMASYEQDDGRFGEKSGEKFYAFLPAGSPKLRKFAQDQPVGQGHRTPLRQGQQQQGLMQQVMQKVRDADEQSAKASEKTAEAKTGPRTDSDSQAHSAGQTGSGQQAASKRQPSSRLPQPPPPPYQKAQAKKYGPPPPPPPSPVAGRTFPPGQARRTSAYTPNKPLPNGAVGALVFAMLSLVPCAGIIFGLIAMIAAGAIKKKILSAPDAYSGLGLVKAAQFIGAIGFAISWIALFAMIKS
ncbi:MAG: hypothetical protein HZA50_09165 [Planctomycetes bacterium]|nr:hypothetical protein [Planctomycetota bacterium]